MDWIPFWALAMFVGGVLGCSGPPCVDSAAILSAPDASRPGCNVPVEADD